MLRKHMEKIEQKAIRINAIFILIMALSGLIFGFLSKSSAIILDGLFSTILFFTLLFAIYIQKVSSQPVTYLYPYSKWRLDTIYILFKVLILLGILLYTLIDSIIVLGEFFIYGIVPDEVNASWIIIYTVIKLSAAIPCYLIYSKYIRQTNNKSEFLHIERKSVVIDGGITFAIFVGFFTIGQISWLKDITDGLILFCLAVFLLYEMKKELVHTMDVLLGKRINVDREKYYTGLLTNWFSEFYIKDIHIEYYGKTTVVSIVSSFNGSKTTLELHNFERMVKKILEAEFGTVFLNIYWDEENKFDCLINGLNTKV